MKSVLKIYRIVFAGLMISCFFAQGEAAAQTLRDVNVCKNLKEDPAEIIRSCGILISTRRAPNGRPLTANLFSSVLTLRAIAYFKSNQDDHALADFDEILRLNLHPDGSIYGLRAILYTRARELDRALADFDRAIRTTKGGTLAENYMNRGVVYLMKEDSALAELDLKKAVSIDPKSKARVEYYREKTESWIGYLRQIQNDGDYANWSRPPLDAARNPN